MNFFQEVKCAEWIAALLNGLNRHLLDIIRKATKNLKWYTSSLFLTFAQIRWLVHSQRVLWSDNYSHYETQRCNRLELCALRIPSPFKMRSVRVSTSWLAKTNPTISSLIGRMRLVQQFASYLTWWLRWNSQEIEKISTITHNFSHLKDQRFHRRVFHDECFEIAFVDCAASMPS